MNDTLTEDEGSLRYAAYANRIRTILLAAHRYFPYITEPGESFRPVAHPYLVTFAYGVSGAYLIGDVSYAVPTVGLDAATWVPGTPAHSWQAVACGVAGCACRFQYQRPDPFGLYRLLPGPDPRQYLYAQWRWHQ